MKSTRPILGDQDGQSEKPPTPPAIEWGPITVGEIEGFHIVHETAHRPDALQWHSLFPTQEGYYWCWDGQTDHAWLIYVQQAWGPEGVHWGYLQDGTWLHEAAFPGYCAGPFLPPPLPTPAS